MVFCEVPSVSDKSFIVINSLSFKFSILIIFFILIFLINIHRVYFQ
jgi:hypothetical protein